MQKKALHGIAFERCQRHSDILVHGIFRFHRIARSARIWGSDSEQPKEASCWKFSLRTFLDSLREFERILEKNECLPKGTRNFTKILQLLSGSCSLPSLFHSRQSVESKPLSGFKNMLRTPKRLKPIWFVFQNARRKMEAKINRFSYFQIYLLQRPIKELYFKFREICSEERTLFVLFEFVRPTHSLAPQSLRRQTLL